MVVAILKHLSLYVVCCLNVVAVVVFCLSGDFEQISNLTKGGNHLLALRFVVEHSPLESPRMSSESSYEEIAAWMEEQAKIEVETETKTERWLELADLQ